MDHLKKLIREVPDFPNRLIFMTNHPVEKTQVKQTIDALTEQVGIWRRYGDRGRSRGFIFATPLPIILVRVGPVRKPKKLPAECVSVSYDLEYGQDTLEMHKDAVGEGHRVLIVDDLLATGGTARAVVDLVEKMGGKVVGLLFVVELDFLGGRAKFEGHNVKSPS